MAIFPVWIHLSSFSVLLMVLSFSFLFPTPHSIFFLRMKLSIFIDTGYQMVRGRCSQRICICNFTVEKYTPYALCLKIFKLEQTWRRVLWINRVGLQLDVKMGLWGWQGMLFTIFHQKSDIKWMCLTFWCFNITRVLTPHLPALFFYYIIFFTAVVIWKFNIVTYFST